MHAEALQGLNLANALKPNDDFTLLWLGARKWAIAMYEEALQDPKWANALKHNDTFILSREGPPRGP